MKHKFNLAFQAAIFDLDGTLVDTVGDFVAALNGMLQDLALPAITPAHVVQWVGKGSEDLIGTTLQHALQHKSRAGRAIKTRSPGLYTAKEDPEVAALFPQAWQRYQHHYTAFNGHFSQLFPGVLQGLQQRQSQGLPMACVTNKPLFLTQPLLKSKGLAPFFGVVLGGDSLPHKKPHPMPLLQACEAMHTQPAHTVMVGDSMHDAQAARAAGCPLYLVTYGYNHGQPVADLAPDALLASLADWV